MKTQSIKIKSKNIKRTIDLYDGRPDRDDPISHDDIIDLKIAFGLKAPKNISPLDFFLYNT